MGTTSSSPGKSGAVTGAVVYRELLKNGSATARQLANEIGLEVSYARTVCDQLVQAGLLTAAVAPQHGTRPTRRYTVLLVG
jgi:predicted ArsR family transcriptional regulator